VIKISMVDQDQNTSDVELNEQ